EYMYMVFLQFFGVAEQGGPFFSTPSPGPFPDKSGKGSADSGVGMRGQGGCFGRDLELFFDEVEVVIVLVEAVVGWHGGGPFFRVFYGHVSTDVPVIREHLFSYWDFHTVFL
ncbi:MAG: hypothetical protein OXG78_01840, partial [Chloroflexi bacterium]|nr:hypothetical protein [Chloroflexota bacterium]